MIILPSVLGVGRSSSYHWSELWERVPTMPGFLSKPDLGKNQGRNLINNLFVYDDEHVFINYGDMILNNGPTDLISLNPKTKEYTIHESNVPTEALNSTFKIGDTLYFPLSDPTGYWEETVPYITWPEKLETGLGNWTHVTSVISHEDKLWVFGAMLGDHNGATIEKASSSWSDDGGVTWNHYTFPVLSHEPYNEIIKSAIDEDSGDLYISSAGFTYYKLNQGLWEVSKYYPATHKPKPTPTVLVSNDMSLFSKAGDSWVSVIQPKDGSTEYAQLWVYSPKV